MKTYAVTHSHTRNGKMVSGVYERLSLNHANQLFFRTVQDFTRQNVPFEVCIEKCIDGTTAKANWKLIHITTNAI